MGIRAHRFRRSHRARGFRDGGKNRAALREARRTIGGCGSCFIFTGKAAARNQTGASRDDSLHERHDEQTQGRRDHSRPYRGANREPRHRVEMERGGSHPALPADAPHPRHHQHHELRDVERRDDRAVRAFRFARHFRSRAQRRLHALHGRADDLREAHPGTRNRIAGGARSHRRGLCKNAPHGLRQRRIARERAWAMDRAHRPETSRTLRHDRDRHGHLESAPRRAPSRCSRHRAARRGGAAQVRVRRHHHRRGRAWRNPSARPRRVPCVLESPRG